MPDIRRSLTGLLKNYGHDVYLQRRLWQDTDPAHPNPVFENKLERHTVRHMGPQTRTMTQSSRGEIEGQIVAVDMVFYFQYNAKPKEGDRIYEGDIRFPGSMITYIIDYALDMRGLGGRTEFYTAGATRETIRTDS